MMFFIRHNSVRYFSQLKIFTIHVRYKKLIVFLSEFCIMLCCIGLKELYERQGNVEDRKKLNIFIKAVAELFQMSIQTGAVA